MQLNGSGRRPALYSLLAFCFAFGACERAIAMPPFAQAYTVNCTMGHLQVPALNAYGRYVQRSGYSVLNHAKLERELPVWIGFNPSYDSQSTTSPHSLQFGNVAVHAVGQLSPAWTYHVQQWIRQDGQPGELDTAWFAYNGFLRGNGHLFFGKIESQAPSPFSQWFDLASFASPELTVGQHQYQLDNNRWGARLAYVGKATDLELSWLGGQEKTFQWKAAYATPGNPLEAGLYGSRAR
jgi:hypothetical protein